MRRKHRPSRNGATQRSTVLVALAVMALGGCSDLSLGAGDVVHGRGHVVSEYRATGSFNAVSNATAADVRILQGNYQRVHVTAEENLLPYLRTRVRNGELQIYTDQGITLRPTQPIAVEVDAGTLHAITSSGSGDVYAPIVDAYRLEIVSSGAGDVFLPDLLADSVVVHSSGGGWVEITGDALRQRVMLSGAGSYDARNLSTYETDAWLSGSGSATVLVRDRLRAEISGAGDLRYYGSPSVQQNVTGSGRVVRAGN